MPVILIIDDQPSTRFQVAEAIKEYGYYIKTLSNPAHAEKVIRETDPDLVLLNRQPHGFDSISFFMHLKDTYPKLPVLLYALRSDTAVKSLKHTVAMAFKEIRPAVEKVVNPPVPAMSRQLSIFNAG